MILDRMLAAYFACLATRYGQEKLMTNIVLFLKNAECFTSLEGLTKAIGLIYP